MTDIVERLRDTADIGVPDFTNSAIMREAANTIEALRSMLLISDQARELRVLRQAMHDIYEVYAGSDSAGPERYWQERIQEMAYIAGKHKRAAMGERDA